MKQKLFLLAGVLVILFSSCNQEKFNDEEFKYVRDGSTVTVYKQETAYKLEPFRSDIIKATFLPDINEAKETASPFIIFEKKDGVQFKVEEYTNRLLIHTSDITVEITKSPFVVNYFDSKKDPLLISSKAPRDSSGYQTMYFESPTDEKFYGMGQKSIPVNRRGYAFDTRNIHIGGYSREYATMQVNIPYIYSSNDYGVFFDNTYTGFFDLAKSNPEEWSYRIDGGNYIYFVTTGSNLQELQTNYYDLTGYPTLPPKWTLGLMQSKCGYIDETEVYGIVEKFEEYNLPLDAIILDAYWFGGYGEDYPQNMGNFTWLKEHFPDPEAYMSSLRQKGIKTLTINEPQINVNSENHDFLVEKDWLMKVDGKPYIQESFWAGSASLLDLTNPAAQDWLWKKLKANVELGLDAFWVDLTEPDVSTPEGEFFAGEEPKIHNIYSFLFAKTLWDGFQKDYPDRRLYNITRAGTAGMQRMGAVHWSGDAAKTFSALETQIPMLIGCAMSGMPHYSSDIGGFTNAWDTISVPWTEYEGGPGVTSPELYTRWFQFGIFSPSLRPHSGEGQACEPFAFDEQTLEITSEYLNLRYQLIPYLYSFAYKTATTGEQLIKPLFMCFDDKKAENRDYEYMFGDLLVAPVFKSGQKEREVYLPELQNGEKWIDFWDNKEYEGGKSYTVNAPIEKIPVFVKGGSILVMGKKKKYVNETPDDTLYLKIYPGTTSEFVLYEDDGKTMGYLKGESKETHIKMKSQDNKLSITLEPLEGEFEGMVQNRTWITQIHQVKDVKEVSVDGEKADFRFDRSQNILELSTVQNINEPVTIDLILK